MGKLLTIFLALFFSHLLFADENKIVEQDLKQLNSLSDSAQILSQEYLDEVFPIIENHVFNKNYVMNSEEEHRLKDYYIRLSLMHIRLLEINEVHSDISEIDNNYGERFLIRYLSSAMMLASSMPLIKDSWKAPIIHKILNDIGTDLIQEGSFYILQNTAFKQLNVAFMLPHDFIYYSIDYGVDEKMFLDVMNTFDFFDSKYVFELQKLMKNIIANEDIINENRSFFKTIGNFEKQIFKASLSKPISYYRQLFKIVSDWIGDTKIKRVDKSYHYGKTLIQKQQLPLMESLLKPGDVLVSRGNWFLSNAFLPSFWPHSFIYLGNVEKLEKYFDDQEVNQFFSEVCLEKMLGCDSFKSYLKNRYTKAWQNYVALDSHGFTKVTIEAISEGVVFSPAEGTLMADYVGAFRPKISKVDIALAIEQAFSHWGKQYDYDFDFRTDKTIVCSELVYRSFMPNSINNKDGLIFNFDDGHGIYVKKYMGKIAMPSGALVQKAYDENILKVRPSQLDFVFYMKGDEVKKVASFSSEDAIYRTTFDKKLSVIYQQD